MNALPPINECLWAQTSKEPFIDCPSAQRNESVDVLIVGAGISGLSTAIHLAKAGLEVVVLEAKYPGYGASGRNGGQAQAGYGINHQLLTDGLRESQAERITQIIDTAADQVFELIKTHQIRCDPAREGLLRGAHHPNSVQMLKHFAQSDPAIEFLNRKQTAKLIGRDIYYGSVLDSRGGAINPMAYTRGLCRVALNKGVKVFANSPALQLSKVDSIWRIETENAVLEAKNIVLVTNAYTDNLYSSLKQTIIPVRSFQIATEPFEGGPLSSGIIASDTRRLVYYYRRDSDGRLLVGGRGKPGQITDWNGYMFLKNWIEKTFPQLKDLSISHYWHGKVAITHDHIPHIHEPESGLHFFGGFNGKGVALATALGKAMAHRIAYQDKSLLGLPVNPIKPIPLWSMREIGINAFASYYRLLDKLGR